LTARKGVARAQVSTFIWCVFINLSYNSAMLWNEICSFIRCQF